MFRLFVFFMSILTGCTDSVLMKVENRQPEILVHPSEINFGNMVSGHESGYENISIINVGEENLIIFNG